jgi:hypothetical protein
MRDDKAEAGQSGLCGDCRHFRNDAKYLEAAFGGLTSLSSAYGSTRSDDGLCLRHDRYLRARSSCRDFSRKD